MPRPQSSLALHRIPRNRPVRPGEGARKPFAAVGVVGQTRLLVTEVGASQLLPQASLRLVEREPPDLMRVLVLDGAQVYARPYGIDSSSVSSRTMTPGRAPAQPQSTIWTVTGSATRLKSKALASRAFRTAARAASLPPENV
jgi:hypothetical protein